MFFNRKSHLDTQFGTSRCGIIVTKCLIINIKKDMNWRNYKMNIKKILNTVMKTISVSLVFLIMYSAFALVYPALLRPSRTLVVFTGAYFVSFSLFNNIFGTFQFGQIKSKPITYTTSLAVLFTDIVAYLSVLVMSTNPNNPEANQKFILENLHVLIFAFLVQLILIYGISYLGNNIYFKYFKPKKTILIKGNEDFQKYVRYLKRYSKQYDLVGVYTVSDFSNKEILKNVDLVLIANIDITERTKITDRLYLENIDFIFTTTITDVITLNGHESIYDDIPVVEVNTNKMTFGERLIKRSMDLAISWFALILSFPLWLIIVIAIKVDDGGKIFFTQKRKTINGKIFEVIKFRTMKEGSQNYSATDNDDRITKVGKILRKVRMDELPQFLNIIQGDMSIVGPRPEMVENIEEYEYMLPEFKYRLKMKAGLTGLAQIEGKYNTSPREKLIMDLSYIENYSVWLDVKLIFRTLIVFFKKDSVDGF